MEARSLLDCMLEPNPESRHTMRDVRAHPWLAGRTHKHKHHQEKDHRYNHRHHHHRQAEELNLRRAERSPRLAGGSPGLGAGSTCTPGRDGASRNMHRDDNDGGCGGVPKGWQHKSPGDNREGAESPTSGGQWISCNSSTTPGSSRHEGYSPFLGCPSSSEGEQETGGGVRSPAGLNHADQVGAGGSVPVPTGGGSCGSTSSKSVATAAPTSFSRSVCGSKATAGMISIARRLGAARLVLSLQLLNSNAAATAETDRATDPGDDDIDGLVPVKALQRALESLGCVCRLLPPTNKRDDERKTPRVKVKACRAIAVDGGRCGVEREADEQEADSIVGVMFSVMLPAEAPAAAGIAPAIDEVDRIAGRLSSSSDSSSTSGSGMRKIHCPETTDFLAVLSTGTVVAFNALVDDLIAMPALPSPSRLGSALPCSMHNEERRDRQQSRPRRGRTIGISGGGRRGRKCSSGMERHEATVATASASN